MWTVEGSPNTKCKASFRFVGISHERPEQHYEMSNGEAQKSHHRDIIVMKVKRERKIKSIESKKNRDCWKGRGCSVRGTEKDRASFRTRNTVNKFHS